MSYSSLNVYRSFSISGCVAWVSPIAVHYPHLYSVVTTRHFPFASVPRKIPIAKTSHFFASWCSTFAKINNAGLLLIEPKQSSCVENNLGSTHTHLSNYQFKHPSAVLGHHDRKKQIFHASQDAPTCNEEESSTFPFLVSFQNTDQDSVKLPEKIQSC
jgi:hypothetical protein